MSYYPSYYSHSPSRHHLTSYYDGVRSPLYLNPPPSYSPTSERARERARERSRQAREEAFARSRGFGAGAAASPRGRYDGLRSPLYMNPPSGYLSPSQRSRQYSTERSRQAREQAFGRNRTAPLTQPRVDMRM